MSLTLPPCAANDFVAHISLFVIDNVRFRAWMSVKLVAFGQPVIHQGVVNDGNPLKVRYYPRVQN